MESNAILSAYRKKVGTNQLQVEQKLLAKDDENISKVLSITAKPYVESMEVLTGEANYLVNVLFEVYYLNENKEIKVMTENMKASGKLEDVSLNSLMQPVYKIETLDVQILSANSSSVNVLANVELTLDVIDNQEIAPYNPTDENILIKNEIVNYYKLSDVGKASLMIQEEFDFKKPVYKILNKTVDVSVKDVVSGTGYFTINGEMRFKALVCFGTEESNELKEVEEVTTFREEVDAEKVATTDTIKLCYAVKNDDITIDISNDNNGVIVSAPVLVKYVAFKKEEQEMPCDAFSLTHKVNIITDTFFKSEMNTLKLKEHIEGNLELDENAPRINKIIMVCGNNLNITNYLLDDEQLKIEGIATLNVVYTADDEEESINSVQVEVPFALSIDIKDMELTNDLFVFGNLLNINVKAKRGKELEVDADLDLTVESYKTIPQTFIKDVVLTEERAKNPYSLQIFLAEKGMTLWDIAKHLQVKEEVIITQNPNLTFPLDQKESVAYFKQS